MDPDRPTEKSRLFAPRQVFVASWVGGPFAAAWFASRTLGALGRSGRANGVMLVGVVCTLLLGFVVWYLPEDFPSQVVPFAYSFGFYALAKEFFGSELNARISDGARLGSWWLVVGLSLAFLVPSLILWVAIGFGLEAVGLISLSE